MEQSRHRIPCTHGPGRPLPASIPSPGVDLLQLNKASGSQEAYEACRNAMAYGLRTNEKCEMAAETCL